MHSNVGCKGIKILPPEARGRADLRMDAKRRLKAHYLCRRSVHQLGDVTDATASFFHPRMLC